MASESSKDFAAEIANHLSSGAIVGHNMSVSEQELTLFLVDELFEPGAVFCLESGSFDVSSDIVSRLARTGILANDCEAKDSTKVKVSGFREPSRGIFELSYTYHAGPRSWAEYGCSVSTNLYGQLVLNECKLKRIS
ncbi:MAG: hypothetical protein AAGB19_21455 [Cyanobacteria bacterium P01_F01_bin.3]